MSDNKTVKVIKANTERSLATSAETLRVAAYVRVSTDHDEQIESLKSQIQYYHDKITKNPEWTLVDIYKDEGISGTGVEKRDDFNRMIRDCLAGKIDMILTKSLSRFSRNVVDTLYYIRLLKERNIAIVFEQENINTLTTNGEMLITVLSAINQLYVENLSDSVKFGLRAKMLRGEYVGNPEALGYDKDPDTGKLVINEAEAEIVRYIFRRYVEGAGGKTIARELEALGYKTKRGNTRWAESTVIGIVKNEKYIGKLLQGKTTTVDPLKHRRIENRGEADKFLSEDAVPAIIDLETFEKAQQILDKRNEGKVKPTDRNRNQYSRRYAFSCKLRCGFCGSNLSRRSHHSGTKHQKSVWHCVKYVKRGKKECPECKAIDEKTIETAFVQTYNLLINNDAEVLSEFLGRLEESLRSTGTMKQLTKVNKQIQAYEKKLQRLLDLLLDGTITNTEYTQKKTEIDALLHPLYSQQEELQKADADEQEIKRQIEKCKQVLANNQKLEVFDRYVFDALVDYVIVGERHEDGTTNPHKIKFIFKAGLNPTPPDHQKTYSLYPYYTL